jgi:DNA polymerase-3 subunit delta'
MSFRDICGHEKQIGILQKAMAGNRVPHAYLFYGVEGIGKKFTAMIFAKALNCENQENLDACDKCSSCLKADHKNHPDIITIEAEGQFIRIQEIRAINDYMQFKPHEGRKRIIILSEAHRMNIASANALLKTLEEPSLNNILILLTSRLHQLPLTIISRCQVLRFNPLKTDTIATFLQTKLSLTIEIAQRLAASSGGSIGRALELNKRAYLQYRDDIFEQLFADPDNNPIKLFFLAQNFGQQSKEITERLDILKTCFRDALVYKETGRENDLIHGDRLDIIAAIAESISGRNIVKNIEAVEAAQRAIEQNANKQLTLEAMMFKLAIK